MDKEKYKKATRKALKTLLKGIAASILMLCIVTPMLLSLPPVQRWLGGVASEVIEDKLGIHTHIGTVQIGWGPRLVLGDVKVFDERDSVALDAEYLAAKIDILPLLNKKIRLHSVQLVDADLHIYKETSDSDLNIKPIIDAFRVRDPRKPPMIDLRINAFVLAGVNIRYDILDQPQKEGGLDANHLLLTNVNASGNIHSLRNDEADLSIKNISLQEKSGIDLKHLSLAFKADHESLSISDMLIQLNGSELSIPSWKEIHPSLPWKAANMNEWIKQTKGEGYIDLQACPSDLKAFLPTLANFNDKILVSAQLGMADGEFQAKRFNIHDADGNLNLEANGKYAVRNSQPTLTAEIQSLHTGEHISQFLSRNLDRPMPQALASLGETTTTGRFEGRGAEWDADLHTSTAIGNLIAVLSSDRPKHYMGKVETTDLMLNKLQQGGKFPSHLTFTSTFDASLIGGGKLPEGIADVDIKQIVLNDITLTNSELHLACHNQHPQFALSLQHPSADMTVSGELKQTGATKSVAFNADIRNLAPTAFGMMMRMQGESIQCLAQGEADYRDIEHIQGRISLNNLVLHSDSIGDQRIGHLTLVSSYDETGRKQININSQPLDATLNGHFHWNELGISIQQIANNYLPELIPAPKQTGVSNNLSFHAYLQDTLLIQRLTGLSLKLPERSIVDCHMDGNTRQLNASGYFPTLRYGATHLTDVGMNVRTTDNVLHTAISGGLVQTKSTINFKTTLQTDNHKMKAVLDWQNDGLPSHKGQLHINGKPYTGLDGKQAFLADIDSSNIVVSDTVWQILPARVDFHDGRLFVDGVGASTGSRLLYVNGIASSSPSDTLIATLDNVEIGYFFRVLNQRKVRFGGETSGRVYANSLLGKPQANAYLHVNGMTLNEANVGNADVYGTYGNHGKAFYLEGHIREEGVGNESVIQGTIAPGRGEGSGLDLNIKADRLNIGFLHSFLGKFMSEVEGNASGKARIFGPLKTVDLEGDLLINEAKLGLKALGTSFNLKNDSVHARPGIIQFQNTQVYDNLGAPGISEHAAILNGQVTHRYFGRIGYEFDIKANNLLGYNRPRLGNDSFCGVAYMSGDVRLWGNYGRFNADLHVTPMSGTIVTYNAAQPDQITDAQFIRYKKPEVVVAKEQAQRDSTAQGSEIYMNFDFNVTPETTLKVLMDLRSGDNITLQGNGHLRASYFNKGRFQIYGTYNVEQGMYDMSIQDFIHKEFKFMPGSNIIFGGRPIQAALNLRGAYTVPNVSLDDLSTTALGLSNTRVDCIMNIGGHPDAPSVTFDFELPNASEEEKQMVRSMLSTEEERNMQVIYLLGIGRFFSFNNAYNASSTQSEMAMNSLVSSTLSSQFNRVLSNAIGSSNWNFGTNLRTGEMGWNNMDVEGMLSGRMLNNRLLVNGNFGYRERLYNTSNFIGDFDVQYLLTPSGSISLKAYNKSNDRYFIQSSLLTQGIGIQLKKDFRRFVDIFRSNKRKSKKESK